MGAHDAKLIEATRALVAAVDGIDWDPGGAQTAVDVILKSGKQASPGALGDALAIVVQRVRRWTPADADGVANVAITGGSLVEFGAPAGPLAEVLLDKMPHVLRAARRYADLCIADLPDEDEEEDDDEDGGDDDGDDDDDDDAGTFVLVDERAISRDLFRSHLEDDRPGGAALHGLSSWTLPLIASLTRDRATLTRAVASEQLCEAAHALRQSDAYWLDVLLGVELNATWLVLCPLVQRGFRFIVDGVVSNFELHTLVADVLGAQGIGKRQPANLVDYIAARTNEKAVSHAEGAWNYYDWRAVGHDVSNADNVPRETWVWNEGTPKDVVPYKGTRVLVVGPAAYQRTWNVGRSFSGLGATVTLERELAADEVRTLVTAMKT